MDKHAYCIIAHKNDYTFCSLLKMLDDERNDIFLHMDEKNKMFSLEEIRNSLRFSTIYIPEKRISVNWGGYSQIDVEMLLLELATSQGEYQYYHLLSGEDLPIKTQDSIHQFFESINGRELVQFESEKFFHDTRVKVYHPFQEFFGKHRKNIILKILQKSLVYVQRTFHISRNEDIVFKKGANWFSITDDFARYIVSKRSWIEHVFKHTYCADEVFVQTLLFNSEYKYKRYMNLFDDNYSQIKRLIDWHRGAPYIFRMEDADTIINSDALFCRKFDAKVDKEIIEFILNRYGG